MKKFKVNDKDTRATSKTLTLDIVPTLSSASTVDFDGFLSTG